MKYENLLHIIRAAGAIAGDDEIIVIGSQAILGQFPNPPEALTFSMEADIWPKNQPEKWDLLDGTLGEGSPFHQAFGYFAQGVEQHTAYLPKGWESRLIPVQNNSTRGITGLCLEANDLCVSKLLAHRPKDYDFVRVALENNLVESSVIRKRLNETNADEIRMQSALSWLNQIQGFKAHG